MDSAIDHRQATQAGRLVRHAGRAVLACALVLCGGLAAAQQRGERDYGGPAPVQHARGERFRMPRQMQQIERDPRQPDVRAYEEQRRMQQYPQPYSQAYPQPEPQERRRMTVDERREMRRQINEAKDFYPQRR